MQTTILLNHNLVALPKRSKVETDPQLLGTVFSNLAYYGYALSKEATEQILHVKDEDLKNWWLEIEPVISEITGTNRKMGDAVVYKNFPKEVLDMSQSEYWVKQILMYWGFHKDNFTQEEKSRVSMLEKLKLKILQPANANSLGSIFSSLLRLPSRWTPDQLKWVLFIQNDIEPSWDVKDIPFKENMALLVAKLIEADVKVKVKSATDVLRLAVGLSEGDVTFETNTPFKSFSKPQRRYLLNLLENSTALIEDVARDNERWKRFLHGLHPNDFREKIGRSKKRTRAKYPTVVQAFHLVYTDEAQSFAGQVEYKFLQNDPSVFEMLKSRPGEFTRRLNKCIKQFGALAVKNFVEVIPNLKTVQLLKLEKYLQTINSRKYRTIAPKGNWTKLQVLDNKEHIPTTYIKTMTAVISKTLRKNINSMLKRYVNLHDSAKMVKLQTSGSELTTYGRGTVFPIPANIKFIRSASYWQAPKGQTIWFDNGWNFFDDKWNNKDTLCWNATSMNGAAVFSGDPVSGWNSNGKACQMIDLYIDKLAARGIRYGVWNILCFSRIKFSACQDVFAAFQWGEDAQAGGLFEPSRAQFTFPVSGDTFAKYILMLDIKERKLVYLDANLAANVTSAQSNGDKLEKTMPAFVEYLDTLPSVHDLFKNARQGKNGLPVAYNDSHLTLKKGADAYVFKQENKNNSFKQLDLNPLLS